MYWLFGSKDIGWLKTALVSGMLGMLIYGIFSGGMDGVGELERSTSGSRYLFILLGYPVWALIRSLYWGSEKQRFLGLLSSGRLEPQTAEQLLNLQEHNERLLVD